MYVIFWIFFSSRFIIKCYLGMLTPSMLLQYMFNAKPFLDFSILAYAIDIAWHFIRDICLPAHNKALIGYVKILYVKAIHLGTLSFIVFWFICCKPSTCGNKDKGLVLPFIFNMPYEQSFLFGHRLYWPRALVDPLLFLGLIASSIPRHYEGMLALDALTHCG